MAGAIAAVANSVVSQMIPVAPLGLISRFNRFIFMQLWDS